MHVGRRILPRLTSVMLCFSRGHGRSGAHEVMATIVEGSVRYLPRDAASDRDGKAERDARGAVSDQWCAGRLTGVGQQRREQAPRRRPTSFAAWEALSRRRRQVPPPVVQDAARYPTGPGTLSVSFVTPGVSRRSKHSDRQRRRESERGEQARLRRTSRPHLQPWRNCPYFGHKRDNRNGRSMTCKGRDDRLAREVWFEGLIGRGGSHSTTPGRVAVAYPLRLRGSVQ